MEEQDIAITKQSLEGILEKMAPNSFSMEITVDQESLHVAINAVEPELLIGQAGQTLFDLQRLINIIVHKKLGRIVRVNVDVNGYKNKKITYLKNLAKNVANEVFLTRAKKILPPMSAYERRIIHQELTGRQDVVTESQGEGEERRIVVNPIIL